MIQGISKRFNNFSSRNFSINEERIVLTSLVQTLSVAVVSQSFVWEIIEPGIYFYKS